MNLPNKLTIIRVILAIAVIYFTTLSTPLGYALALLLFILAAFTDFADGVIARKKNLITDFGKIADPIADKILTLGAFLAFVMLGLYNYWILIGIALREIALTVIRIIALRKNIVLAAEKMGKIKTASQMIVILFIYAVLLLKNWVNIPHFIQNELIDILMIYILLVTLISGINFLWNNKQNLKNL